jgi:hypothetical protein
MTKRYTGGVVSSSLPTVNAAGASGVFLLSQQSDYQSRNAWPPYKIEESLRFRASASAQLTRAVAGINTTQLTYSAWFKLSCNTSNDNTLFATQNNSSNYLYIGFPSDLTLDVQIGATANRRRTTQVFRDPSAWYHLVVTFDTTQSTAADRIKIYLNGTQVTAFSTSTTGMSQNANLPSISSALTNYIGGYNGSSGFYFDGYMAEINTVYGQALTPSSFGATDKDGNWSPIAYTGTYGTNGFYLNFRDNTSATTMGLDYSGNGNNWTLNGFNVSTANTTYDIMIDVPEDQAGANNRGSYCTLNPLSFYNSQTTSINCTNGNLNIKAHTVNGDTRTFGTMGVSTGKWYFESNIVAVDSTYGCVGISDIILAYGQAQNTGNWWVYIADGKKYNGVNPVAGGVSYGNTYTTGDVIGIAVDLDNGKIWFSKNGTYQASGDPVAGTNAAFTNVAGTIYPVVYTWAINSEQALNFGQRPFTYAPPSGFKTLNTFNLPEPTIKQPNRHFDAIIRNGFGSSGGSVTSLNFQPDFLWEKARSTASNHTLIDSIRGVTKELFSNLTNAESTGSNFLASFNSNGFTMGSNDWGTSTTVVDWIWNAGGANTTNTSGSVTSIVRANPTAGFSIVTYTANASDPITVGHGLGVAPSVFMVKSRSAAGTDWFFYHSSLGATKNLRLNTTAAAATATNVWNDTAPTSSVITTSNAINTNGVTYVAYCFAPVAGYSAFGSYTGNASTDGPFVYTGFRPRWVMVKNITSSQSWQLMDSVRSTYNAATANLLPNSNTGELTGTDFIDMLSNGFKIRQSSAGNWNNSGDTYIYAAFAETPFKYARSR